MKTHTHDLSRRLRQAVWKKRSRHALAAATILHAAPIALLLACLAILLLGGVA